MKILSRSILGIFIACVGFSSLSTQEVFASEKSYTATIQGYILEAYKVQGDSIVATLSQNLTKMYPNLENRKKAFINIQTSLSLKKQAIQKHPKISQMTRTLLSQYLDYMIFKIEQEKQKIK